MRARTAVGPAVETEKLSCPRVAAIREVDRDACRQVVHLAHLAVRGLTVSYNVTTVDFAQTLRGVAGPGGAHLQRDGVNLRYGAMAALGISRLPEPVQHQVLAGRTAADVARAVAERALTSPDAGAVALAAWSYAEVTGSFPDDLVGALRGLLLGGQPLTTVELAWLLTAAVAASGGGDVDDLVGEAAARLRRSCGPAGTYPHLVRPAQQARWRAHVGSFADQVYPLQALARASVLTGDRWMRDAAERTAARLCELQGAGGQWWWHYDARTGDVIERYPVYSVHQHAMAPMVLLDLHEAGGSDRRPEVAAGLRWLDDHPEVVEELVSDRFGVVWRKVGRREPRKAARALNAATSAVAPGWRAPGVDRLFPAELVDHECRPYELGWFLYAWLPAAAAGGDHDA